MNTTLDTTFSFRDFTNEQLFSTGKKSGELLVSLPESDGYHRQLAIDLSEEVSLLERILGYEAANEFTFLKRQLDDERDNLYAGLAESIRSARRHPVAAKSEAALRLTTILDRRQPSLHRLSDDENTAELTLLLTDFAKPEAQADLGSLGLTEWCAKLQVTTGEFVEAVLEETRSASANLEKLPSITTVKRNLGTILRMLLQGIAYQAGKQRAPYVELAAQLDEALAAIRSVSVRRTNRKAKAKKKATLNA